MNWCLCLFHYQQARDTFCCFINVIDWLCALYHFSRENWGVSLGRIDKVYCVSLDFSVSGMYLESSLLCTNDVETMFNSVTIDISFGVEILKFWPSGNCSWKFLFIHFYFLLISVWQFEKNLLCRYYCLHSPKNTKHFR